MKLSQVEIQASARAEAFAMPIEQIDPGSPAYFENDTVGHYFERLRRDDPVHHCNSALYGSYWSVTRFQDIMQVDTNHGIYSSDWTNGGIAITEPPPGEGQLQMFIAMDPPRHDVQRKAVQPIVAPANLANMQNLIRERTCKVLDGLPHGETFNWVEHVSIELTTLMLATLFDFPLEDRHLLTHWSDVATANKDVDPKAPTREERLAELHKMAAYFTRLWNERVNASPGSDLISMMAHNPETRNMTPQEFMGNLVLLIVGGNDTTRNSMTGGLLALHDNPGEWDKLRNNPALVDNMVSEIIRWQTPLAHMRRTALQDTELGGKQIKKGDKVVMWYLSGNRDEDAIPNASQFIIDRPRARQHLSFGFGIHRCVGNRLAEMQLRILWEEIHKRFPVIEVVADPVRVRSPFVRGFTELMVRIPK
ncbi:cytochrome P450 [Limnohabitans sp.]|uniref:cytochrome P450 n=1 Tax=Limnohabitans sp. TaxID=1907725 RepID=UPI00391B66D7